MFMTQIRVICRAAHLLLFLPMPQDPKIRYAQDFFYEIMASDGNLEICSLCHDKMVDSQNLKDGSSWSFLRCLKCVFPLSHWAKVLDKTVLWIYLRTASNELLFFCSFRICFLCYYYCLIQY